MVSHFKILSIVGLFTVLMFTCHSSASGIADEWSMPDPANAIQLSWINGPPQIQAFRPEDAHVRGFRAKDSILAFRSGKWGMLLDPQNITVKRMTVAPVKQPGDETLAFSSLQESWPESQLELTATLGGKSYRATGGEASKGKDYLKDVPIRIVESGTWFQHVAIYDLELFDDAGVKLPGKSWFEVRAWGDSCVLQWNFEPANNESEERDSQALGEAVKTREAEDQTNSGKITTPELSIELKCKAAGLEQQRTAVGNSVRLLLNFNQASDRPSKHDAIKRGKIQRGKIQRDKEVRVQAASDNPGDLGKPKVEFSNTTNAWEIRLPKQTWQHQPGQAYPEMSLDRTSQFDLTLENQSDQPKQLKLRFLHPRHPITGYVPMVLNFDGSQTGLPLQNSKNWHVDAAKPQPYQGQWIHVTTRLQIAPRTKVKLKYLIAHAQWQGLPASSAAQLSLIGWGSNGFWTQMALGSWGESICIQPGRALRRAFVTDVRPFMMRSKEGKTYGWAANVGGADIAKIIDDENRYVLWRGAVGELVMIGPNLSHVRVRERSADESIKMQIDTFLPRSKSINRSYFKVRLEVLKDTPFLELVLFQLGSDYYNDLDAQLIAYGRGAVLTKELKPPPGNWTRTIAPMPMKGNQPWASLYGAPDDPEYVQRGCRGIIVRHFEALLDGKRYPTPWLQSSRTGKRLNAELVLPPKVQKLVAGDTIEFEIEMNAFPPNASAYYGGDNSLKERLTQTPDSWELTAYEAKHQRLALDGKAQAFPAEVAFSNAERQSFSVTSRSKMDTVCISGLPRPGTWKLTEKVDGISIPFGDRFPEEAHPQLNYDLDSGTWTAVLTLSFPERTGSPSPSMKRIFAVETTK